MKDDKTKIIELLEETERPGILDLINFLENSSFFYMPASTKYHRTYRGGLAKHSLEVYYLLSGLNEHFKLKIPHESIVISSLLHDICKIDNYIFVTEDNIRYNKEVVDKRHAAKSLDIISKFIDLTELERNCIKYHMGFYYCFEFNSDWGEYSISELSEAYNKTQVVKLFAYCDDMESQFKELSEK